MSVTSLVYLHCDDPDCDEVFTPDSEPGDTGTSQRRDARADGWAVALPGGRDLCPDHRPRRDRG